MLTLALPVAALYTRYCIDDLRSPHGNGMLLAFCV